MLQEERRAHMTSTTSLLADALRGTAGVDAWQVTTTQRDEAQVYLIGATIEEARRSVSYESATATLHNLHAPHTPQPEGQALGETTLTLTPEDLEERERLSARLRNGALMASLTDNHPYRLPSMPARGYPFVDADDIGMGASLEMAAQRVAQQVRHALHLTPGVRLGSAEIYASRTSHLLTNSQGLSASKRETGAFLDMVIIAGAGDHAAEFHAELHRRRLSDLHVDRIITAYSAFALHALHASPAEAWQGPVILSGEAAAQLFNPLFGGPFAAHTSAEMAFRQMSRFRMGEFITPAAPRGDRLTLASDATRPHGVRTSAYDSSGVPAQNVTLIEQGVFRRPWADAKYAQYLGVEATGDLGNLTVSRGATPLAQLRSVADGPVYEIVAFSLFNPDPVTGDFSTEIRLGYRYDASGVSAIKGGTLVGNMFTAFGDARFSSESYSDGVYFGPSAIRFADLTITGA